MSRFNSIIGRASSRRTIMRLARQRLVILAGIVIAAGAIAISDSGGAWAGEGTWTSKGLSRDNSATKAPTAMAMVAAPTSSPKPISSLTRVPAPASQPTLPNALSITPSVQPIGPFPPLIEIGPFAPPIEYVASSNSGTSTSQSSSPCRCRYNGKKYRLGDIICMTLPDGSQTSRRCGLELNNTSWIIAPGGCKPIS